MGFVGDKGQLTCVYFYDYFTTWEHVPRVLRVFKRFCLVRRLTLVGRCIFYFPVRDVSDGRMSRAKFVESRVAGARAHMPCATTAARLTQSTKRAARRATRAAPRAAWRSQRARLFRPLFANDYKYYQLRSLFPFLSLLMKHVVCGYYD